MCKSPKVGLLVPGMSFGGGVPNSAIFARAVLAKEGYNVDVIEPATSRADLASTRLMSPKTWGRKPRIVEHPDSDYSFLAGSHFAEIEVSRYLPRQRLTSLLSKYDLVFAIAGFPAWAHLVKDCSVPFVLQIASLSSWERTTCDPTRTQPYLNPRKAMNAIVHRLDSTGVLIPDLLLTMNQKLREWAILERGSASNVEVVTPGVDTSYFSQKGVWNKSGGLISVGRLGEPRKGWGRLFQSYNTAVSLDPQIPQLRIIGSGKLNKNDALILNSLQHRGRISVVSDVSRWQLREYLLESRAYIQSSFEEGLGLAALEGMACGLPVISLDSAGPRMYVVQGETGFLLDNQSSDFGVELAQSIEIISGHKGLNMSLAARRFCSQNFSMAATAQKLTKSLQAIL